MFGELYILRGCSDFEGTESKSFCLLRVFVRSRSGGATPTRNLEDPPHHIQLVEELSRSCLDGGFLANCSNDELFDVALRIYDTFGTGKAARVARDAPLSVATEFFSQFCPPDAVLMDNTPEPVANTTTANDEAGISFTNLPVEPGAADVIPDEAGGDAETGVGDESYRLPEAPKAGAAGDVLLFNDITLYRDLLFYKEINLSIKDGDIGRTFETFKVLGVPLSLCFSKQVTDDRDSKLFSFSDYSFLEPDRTTMDGNYCVSPLTTGTALRPRLRRPFLKTTWSTCRVSSTDGMNVTFSKSTSTSG